MDNGVACGMLVLGGPMIRVSAQCCVIWPACCAEDDMTCECEGDALNGSVVVVIVVWALSAESPNPEHEELDPSSECLYFKASKLLRISCVHKSPPPMRTYILTAMITIPIHYHCHHYHECITPTSSSQHPLPHPASAIVIDGHSQEDFQDLLSQDPQQHVVMS
ncbi:hypothetical protein E2C01_015031 [Portunus trituberculatus]|uniref:Uncharacterized protein n=1 Tax=Portunus trituberculatus TaxID=210409 RepID=A0A5B7DLW0_PORTR|nr:hypothetical protein [Portunus trituberculatus]